MLEARSRSTAYRTDLTNEHAGRPDRYAPEGRRVASPAALRANRLATRIATTSEGHPHRPAGLLKVPGKVFDRPGEIQDGLANPRYRHTKIVEHLTSHRCIGDSYYVPCARTKLPQRREFRKDPDGPRTTCYQTVTFTSQAYKACCGR